MDVLCRLGALEFRLARVEHQALPEMDSHPFLLLPDGTEVRRTTEGLTPYLVVDHRDDVAGMARVEYWETVNTAEAPVRGLITLCDALSRRY